jgi:hypothetical protein
MLPSKKRIKNIAYVEKKKKQKVISYPQSQDSTHSNWKMNKNINTLSKHQWKGAKELLFKANIPL